MWETELLYCTHMLIWCCDRVRTIVVFLDFKWLFCAWARKFHATYTFDANNGFFLLCTFYFIGYAAHKHIQLLPPEMHNFSNEMNVLVKTDKQYTQHTHKATNSPIRVTKHFQFHQLIGHDLSLFWDWPHYYYVCCCWFVRFFSSKDNAQIWKSQPTFDLPRKFLRYYVFFFEHKQLDINQTRKFNVFLCKFLLLQLCSLAFMNLLRFMYMAAIRLKMIFWFAARGIHITD